MAEQGMKIFSGIFKRTYRSLKKEFRKLYRLNQFYVTELTEFGGGGMLNYVKPEDYQKGDSSDVAPSADPNIISDTQRMQQAQAMLQLASTTPGVNLHEAQIRYAKALKVPDIDRILPDPNGPDAIPPMPNPKIQVENIKAQVKQADTQLKFKLGMMKIMKDAETKQAQIHKLEAEAMKAIADAKGVQTGHAIAAMNTEIAAAKHRQDGLLKAIETMMKVSDSMSQDNQQENAPTMGETSVP
jgi:hypothetical protein